MTRFALPSIVYMIALACSAHAAGPVTVPASDPLFLGSVLDETWDVSHAAKDGSIDCMNSLSDVDLNVAMPNAGVVTLNFDPSVYAPSQNPLAGPNWKVQVDGAPPSKPITIGPTVATLSTPSLPPGTHRVRFVNTANTEFPRWFPHDPGLARVTGVTLPDGAHLEKSSRPTAWILAISDSIGEGAFDMNSSGPTFKAPGAYTDASNAWDAIAIRMLHKSAAGFLIAGIGMVRGGSGVPFGALNASDPTGKNDPWDHIYAGVPRPFTTPPDCILLWLGTNEWASDGNMPGNVGADPRSTDVGLEDNLNTFFTRVRGHAQLATTPIIVGVPFGGYKRTAMQKAIAAYCAAHPDEKHIQLCDVAFGSPALANTAGIDEKTLFGGLTRNQIFGEVAPPSAESADRVHPYGIATPAMGSVNAHLEIAQVIAPRIATILAGGPPPPTGELAPGKLDLQFKANTAQLTAPLATGGSAPYAYQFEKSGDNGKTWSPLGAPIRSMQTTLQPLATSDANPARGTLYRLTVKDSAEPQATARTDPVAIDQAR